MDFRCSAFLRQLERAWDTCDLRPRTVHRGCALAAPCRVISPISNLERHWRDMANDVLEEQMGKPIMYSRLREASCESYGPAYGLHVLCTMFVDSGGMTEDP